MLQRCMRAEDWFDLDELIIVASPSTTLTWPNSIDRDRMMVLVPGEEVIQEEGWVDAELLNNLMRSFERLKRFFAGKAHGDGSDDHTTLTIPVVKVVQLESQEEC